jgi:hypothetical protein
MKKEESIWIGLMKIQDRNRNRSDSVKKQLRNRNASVRDEAEQSRSVLVNDEEPNRNDFVY